MKKFVTAIHCSSESSDHYQFIMFSDTKPTYEEVKKFVLDTKAIDILWDGGREDDEPCGMDAGFNDIGALRNYITVKNQ